MLFLCIYLISLSKNTYAGIVFGIGLSMKLNLVIAAPLIFIYFSKKNIQLAIKFFIITTLVFLMLNSPFLLSEGFQNLVLFNDKQSLLFNFYLSIGNLKLYIPVLFFTLLYFHFFSQKKD